MKRRFELEHNGSYPKQRGIVNIIGSEPEDKPYLSICFMYEGNQIAHSWVSDKDLERLAVNILKAIKSKKLNHGK